MNLIFKKLNYKGHRELYVLNAPKSFAKAIDEMKTMAIIKRGPSNAKEVEFFLAFVTKQKEVENLTIKVTPLIKNDGLLWFAYPKGTSKMYTCEFNRDTGWNELGKNGFEAVRTVAIDEDWSALRFRKVEHIKRMTRSFAMTDAGKKKVSATKKRGKS